MVKIFKPYGDEKPESKCNDPGSIIEPQYKERYDERGVAYLEHVGDVNTYEKIQSYKEDCDISCILSRYAAGDQSVLATPGWYIDTSKMPQSYHEWMNTINEQKERFESLPLEVRQKFGMSFEQYAATAGTEEWAKAMGLEKKPVETEVAADEQKQ